MKLFGQSDNDKSSIYKNKNDEQNDEKKLFNKKYENEFNDLRVIRNKLVAHFDFDCPLKVLSIEFIDACLKYLEDYFNRHPIIKTRKEIFNSK